MLIRLLEPPVSLPVTLAEFKAHAKIEHGDEDAVLRSMLLAATEHVASELGRVLAPAQYRVELPQWRDRLCIPLSPVREIVAVSYVGEDGAAVALSPMDWSWVRTGAGAILRFADDFQRPRLIADGRADAVRVDLDAGYDDPASSGSGDDPELRLPSRVGLAIKVLAASWAENREATSAADMKVVPLVIEALLRAPGLKVYR